MGSSRGKEDGSKYGIGGAVGSTHGAGPEKGGGGAGGRRIFKNIIVIDL